MIYKPGAKLSSVVCDAQFVVIRAPQTELELACGGRPLAGPDEGAASDTTIDPQLSSGTLLGKRYANEALGLELLCSRAGDGTLTCDGDILPVKDAKPLPSSD